MSYSENSQNNRFKRTIKDPVIIPYNINNKLIKDVDLKEMMNNYDIKLDVVDIELYRQALTHKSYIKKEFYSKNSNELNKAKAGLGNVLELREESNERLEFLGDTVIKSVIAEYLSFSVSSLHLCTSCAWKDLTYDKNQYLRRHYISRGFDWLQQFQIPVLAGVCRRP